MKIVGCDLHARQQTLAMMDSETGEYTEKTLVHEGSASTSAALTQIVRRATITMSLTSTPNPSPAGKTATFTTTFKSTGGLATGQVTFSSAGTTLGEVTIGTLGKAILSTAILPVGSDVVTATYTGNMNYSSATMRITQVVPRVRRHEGCNGQLCF